MRYDLALAVMRGRERLFEAAQKAAPPANLGGNVHRITSMDGLKAFLSRGPLQPGAML